MEDTPWVIIGWAIIMISVGVIVGILFIIAKAFVKQKLTNLKRKRANAGKVRCEEREEPCQRIAVRVTPNGYFCGDHWQQNSRRAGAYATVSWGHALNHVMKGRE